MIVLVSLRSAHSIHNSHMSASHLERWATFNRPRSIYHIIILESHRPVILRIIVRLQRLIAEHYTVMRLNDVTLRLLELNDALFGK